MQTRQTTVADVESLDIDNDGDESEGERGEHIQSGRFSDGRIVIEDRGQWQWTLSVVADGVIRASKAIPYDGTVTYSTRDCHSNPRRRSQHRLSVEQVIGRYRTHSETDRSTEALLSAVGAAQAALKERGATDE